MNLKDTDNHHGRLL